MVHNQPTRVSPLLSLPSHIRQRIYTSAGILGADGYPRFVNLNNRAAPRDDSYRRDPFIITNRLLLTCQTVYQEVAARVYESNSFSIRFNDYANLEALRRLRPGSIRALRSLMIHLNVTSCGLGLPCECYLLPWKQRQPYNRHDSWPLRISDQTSKVRYRHLIYVAFGLY